MTEFLPGIYKVLQKTDRGNTTEINIFIIPGKKGERSLMIDAGFQDENCLAQMEGVLKELDISYEDLDVFLTHKHHDHSGLASVYADRGATMDTANWKMGGECEKSSGKSQWLDL